MIFKNLWLLPVVESALSGSVLLVTVYTPALHGSYYQGIVPGLGETCLPGGPRMACYSPSTGIVVLC